MDANMTLGSSANAIFAFYGIGNGSIDIHFLYRTGITTKVKKANARINEA